MRHGTRQLCDERAHHGAWHPATGLVLRRRVAGFVSAVDRTIMFEQLQILSLQFGIPAETLLTEVRQQIVENRCS
jgi:hypothetical protein